MRFGKWRCEEDFWEFSIGPLYGIIVPWRGFWFRFFGYGPYVMRDKMVLFSERYGYRKVLRIGRWAFEWLRPQRKPSGDGGVGK
jgi:hypothetical protein